MEQDLAWYAKRLSVMAPRELLHRLGEEWRVLVLRARFLAGQGTKDSPYPVEQFSFCSASAPQLPQLEWEFDQEAPVHSDLLSGKWKALRFDWEDTVRAVCEGTTRTRQSSNEGKKAD